jgi:hypothetical protein
MSHTWQDVSVRLVDPALDRTHTNHRVLLAQSIWMACPWLAPHPATNSKQSQNGIESYLADKRQGSREESSMSMVVVVVFVVPINRFVKDSTIDSVSLFGAIKDRRVHKRQSRVLQIWVSLARCSDASVNYFDSTPQ